MPNAFTGLEIASRALRSFNRGLDVAGHNIANVNTPGYSRQVVDFSPTDPTTFWGSHIMSLGTGVNITSVNRVQDLFLQQRMGLTQSQLGRFETAAGHATQVEGLFLETGSEGISSALDRFFNAWSGLASNPSDAARLEVQQAGKTLADRVRGLFRDLTGLQDQTKTEIEGSFDTIDNLTTEIARLNREITTQVAQGMQPNDLMDQRDQAVEELSKFIDVQTHPQEDGSILVYMGSLSLVDRSGARPFPRTYDPATFSLTVGTATHKVRSGKLFGLFEAFNRITAHKASIDTFANNLRTEFNALHITGTNPNATTGINFFAETGIPPTTGAIDFALDPQILADVNNISSGTSGAPGDTGLALSLSQLRDAGIAGLGNDTFSDFYSGILSIAATDVTSSKTNFGTQSAVAQQIENQRQSVRGVSLDEEMAAMLRFQRSYQAAAKALSVFDKVTEDLINMV
jgi:flagellar hook-associated protein 1 FlgK